MRVRRWHKQRHHHTPYLRRYTPIYATHPQWLSEDSAHWLIQQHNTIGVVTEVTSELMPQRPFSSFFFAKICAQSFYSSSPMGEKDLYTGGPHGLLSCFITNVIPGIFMVFSTSGKAISYPIKWTYKDAVPIWCNRVVSAAMLKEGSKTTSVPPNLT